MYREERRDWIIFLTQQRCSNVDISQPDSVVQPANEQDPSLQIRAPIQGGQVVYGEGCRAGTFPPRESPGLRLDGGGGPNSVRHLPPGEHHRHGECGEEPGARGLVLRSAEVPEVQQSEHARLHPGTEQLPGIDVTVKAY